MLKKNILIIGNSSDLLKTFYYLFKNNQVRNVSFRKTWHKQLKKKYDIIIISGFHHHICTMDKYKLHEYIVKYEKFVLNLKPNCKKLYLVTTDLNLKFSISRVVFFYSKLRNSILKYKKVNIISFDTVIGHEKSIVQKIKVKIFNLLRIKTFHFKSMYKKFQKSEDIKRKKIKFILIDIPRSRSIDRILRLLIDLFLLKWINFYTK